MTNDLSSFNLTNFVDSIDKAQAYSKDQAEAHQRVLKTYNLLMKHDYISEELLQQVSLEDLEWVFNLILYWPDYELGVEAEDLEHEGIQSSMIAEIIDGFSQIKTMPKKVTFI